MNPEAECLPVDLPSPLEGFKFTQNWLAGDAALRKLLPSPDEIIRQRMDNLPAQWKPWDADEVEFLRQYNIQMGNSAGADLAGALADASIRVVVTGQQPNFLVSPLYILHKTLSAIAWARKLSKEYQCTVIPVFWIASDDDDFAELKQARLVSWDGSLVDVGSSISRGGDLPAGAPASSWDLTESRDRVTASLRETLDGWDKGADILAALESEILTVSGFEQQFGALLSRLLGDENPILFIAPRIRPMRVRQMEILLRDMECHESVNERINRSGVELESAGYPVSLQRDAASLNFFWLRDGLRHRLEKRADGIAVLEPQRGRVVETVSVDSLKSAMTEHPEDFIPNVITRPVLQDTALPVLTYIAGPGELAYLALLGETYQFYGKSRAAVMPRTSVTMVPSCSVRRSACVKPPEQLAEEILEQGNDESRFYLSQISDLNREVSRRFTAMKAQAGQGAEILKAVEKTDLHIRHGVNQLMRRLAKQVAGTEWNRVARLSALVAPVGSAQERTVSPLSFLNSGDFSALTQHLATHVDYTSREPVVAPLPAWIEAEL